MIIDTTLVSDNSSRFRKESFRKNLIVTIDDKIMDEIIQLTEKQQKYQHCLQVKLINMNILQVKKYYHLIKIE